MPLTNAKLKPPDVFVFEIMVQTSPWIQNAQLVGVLFLGLIPLPVLWRHWGPLICVAFAAIVGIALFYQRARLRYRWQGKLGFDAGHGLWIQTLATNVKPLPSHPSSVPQWVSAKLQGVQLFESLIGLKLSADQVSIALLLGKGGYTDADWRQLRRCLLGLRS
jgi:hypothetical protein